MRVHKRNLIKTHEQKVIRTIPSRIKYSRTLKGFHWQQFIAVTSRTKKKSEVSSAQL